MLCYHDNGLASPVTILTQILSALSDFNQLVLKAQEELNNNFICFGKLFMPTLNLAENRDENMSHKKSRQGVTISVHICTRGLQKVKGRN